METETAAATPPVADAVGPAADSAPAAAAAEPTVVKGTSIDEQGRETARSVLTPTTMGTRAACLFSSKLVVPIIFLPGIMGTRLRSVRNRPDRNSWMPPEGTWDALKAVLGGLGKDAATRQELLDPENTEVDDSGPAQLDEESCELMAISPGATQAERTRWRGWSQLYAESYGPILLYLEKRLANIFDHNSGGKKLDQFWVREVMSRQDAASTGAQQPFVPLTEAELRAAAEVLYPVHAVGYNWLKSNKDSGLLLSQEIDRITAYYRGVKKICDGVVIVTHSMGGLVARACVASGQTKSEIFGVVHGVMPAIGAPAAYKRIRAGFEGVEQVVMGRDAAECTAVMGNSPGALELLPTPAYRAKVNGVERHWLRAAAPETEPIPWEPADNMPRPDPPPDVTTLLGEGDPYKEIYLNNSADAWWRLIKEELIDPAGRKKRAKEAAEGKPLPKADKADSDFGRYTSVMQIAIKLHQAIHLNYHPNTYASYASDVDRKSWNEVCWRTQRPVAVEIRRALSIHDNLNGKVKLAVGELNLRFSIDGPLGPGDGTVPAESGGAPLGQPGVRQIFRHEGKVKKHESYDHQNSYKSELVQAVTLYSIIKIISSSDWLRVQSGTGKEK